MTATTTKTFEMQPFYLVEDEKVLDQRVIDVAEKLLPAIDNSLLSSQQQAQARRRSDRLMHPFSNVDQRGRDGEDYSGFVAKADIHAADGRELTIVHSWLGGNNTGLPRPNSSWSAEFDDKSVADDFWHNYWTPAFNGFDFVHHAESYLKDHPEIPRRTVRIQELGLLHAWHSQRLGEHVLLEKFSTDRHELVWTPDRYEHDEEFEIGRVYDVPLRDSFGITGDHAAKTCLAAFIVEGGEYPSYGHWRTRPSATYVQWSDGMLRSYSHPLTAENGPVPLKPSDLNQD